MRLRAKQKDVARRRRYLHRYGYSKAVIDQTLNVYDAEDFGNATINARLKTQKDVRLLVAAIMSFPYWKRRNKNGRNFKVKFTGKNAKWAYGGYSGISLPGNGRGRDVHTIVHEMAHAISSGVHGREFIKVLLVLTREFEGAHYAKALKERLYQTGALKRPRRRKS